MELSSIFKDLMVVELSSVLAGPAVGMFFAELGARVIKVENKPGGGDITRSWKLPTENPQSPYSAYYHSVNWGKEAYFMNLNMLPEKEKVLSWIQQADILICNFKAGSAEKLGFGYEQLKTLNPRLIYGAINAYGAQDPRPGFDAMIQAETGWVFMNGTPDRPPVKLPVALMDILTAHQLKEGLLVALLKRQETGKGSLVTVSLFDTGVASLANQASNWLNEGVLPRRKGSQHPNIAPYGDIFTTKDGRLIMLGIGNDLQFQKLCKVLSLDGVAEDPKFSSNTDRLTHRNLLNELLEDAFSKQTIDQFLQACRSQQITVAPINDMRTLFEIPEAKALILESTLPNGEVAKSVKTAVFKIL